MNTALRRWIVFLIHRAIAQVGMNLAYESRFDRLFYRPRATGHVDYIIRWMRAAEGASQKLAGKHFGVRGNWEHPAFRMEMLPRRHLVAACGETQSRVLDVLESLKRGRFHIPRPDRGRVIHLGPDEGFVGDNQRLGVLAPGSAGQGLHDPEALRARLRHRFGVGREGVERVEGHA